MSVCLFLSLFSPEWFVCYHLDQRKSPCGYLFILKISYKVKKLQSDLTVNDGKPGIIFMFPLSPKLMPYLNSTTYLQL